MKYSKQREIILKAVLDNRIHPTAEEVYEIVKNSMPNISLGTIYRNLNQLSKAGLIKKIFMSNSNDRFDNFEIRHNHLYCNMCNTIYDIPIDLKIMCDMIKEKTGHTILQNETMFIGICENCQYK